VIGGAVIVNIVQWIRSIDVGEQVLVIRHDNDDESDNKVRYLGDQPFPA
jgi:hypothetical protein